MVDTKQIRQQAIKEAKNKLILEAALKAFAEKGFHDTRMEDIAVYAGFSKASLYNYYKDKEDIFINLAIKVHGDVIDAINSAIILNDNLENNIRSILKALFSTIGRYFAILITFADLEFIGRIGEVIKSQNNPDCQKMMLELFDKYEEILSGLFDLAKKKGEIQSSIDTKILTVYFSALVKGILFEWKRNGKMKEDDETIENLILFLKEGLKVPQNIGIENDQN